MTDFDTYVFVQPGKAYFSIDYRAMIFRFANEISQAVIDTGYVLENGFVNWRAAVSGPSNGYFVGGSLSVSQKFSKISFLTDTASVVSGQLTRRHPRSLGASGPARGYIFGGTNTSDDKQGIFVDKISFATEAITAGGDLLSPTNAYQNHLWKQAAQDAEAAFLRSDDTSENPNRWSKYNFVGETHELLGLVPVEARQAADPPVVSDLAAYTPIHPAGVLEKFSFNTETAAALGLSLLPSGVRVRSAASGSHKGYLVGSNGTTYGLSFLSEREEVVSTALQGTVGTAIISKA